MEQTYVGRLDTLNLMTITSLRDYFTILNVCNILINFRSSIVFKKLIINNRHPELLTFKHLKSKNDTSKYCIPTRFVRSWNSLPVDIRHYFVINLNSFLFKSKIKDYFKKLKSV